MHCTVVTVSYCDASDHPQKDAEPLMQNGVNNARGQSGFFLVFLLIFERGKFSYV